MKHKKYINLLKLITTFIIISKEILKILVILKLPLVSVAKVQL